MVTMVLMMMMGVGSMVATMRVMIAMVQMLTMTMVRGSCFPGGGLVDAWSSPAQG